MTTPAAELPGAAPPAAETPAWKLLAVLGGGGAVAGLVIVTAFQATQPSIRAHRAEVLQAAVAEVLGAPARWETLYVVGGALTASPPQGADPSAFDRCYAGWRDDGTPIGFAIVAAEPGFADDVKLIFGFDAERQVVLGFKVLENKETPGLGDAIEKKPAFAAQFVGKEVPVAGIKKGASRGRPQSEVETLTGATISSATVVRIVNNAAVRWTPLLRAWRGEAGR